MRMQRAQFGIAFGGVLGGVVRMHASGRKQFARMLARQFQCARRVFAAGAGDDDLCDAGVACALQHFVAVAVEGVVGQVGADIDQLHGNVESEMGNG